MSVRRRIQLSDLCEILLKSACTEPAKYTVDSGAPGTENQHRVCRAHVGHAIEAVFTEDFPVQVVPDFALEGVTFRGSS